MLCHTRVYGKKSDLENLKHVSNAVTFRAFHANRRPCDRHIYTRTRARSSPSFRSPRNTRSRYDLFARFISRRCPSFTAPRSFPTFPRCRNFRQRTKRPVVRFSDSDDASVPSTSLSPDGLLHRLQDAHLPRQGPYHAQQGRLLRRVRRRLPPSPARPHNGRDYRKVRGAQGGSHLLGRAPRAREAVHRPPFPHLPRQAPLREGGRRADLPQARGPQPHRRAQDQPLPGRALAKRMGRRSSSPRRARASTASRSPPPPPSSASSATSTWARSTWRRNAPTSCA